MSDEGGPGPAARAPWRTIQFRLEDPGARRVSVVGDFNDWDAGRHPLRCSPSGLWEGQVPLPPGRYGYAFDVDGTLRPDPNCERQVHGQDGEVRCLIEVDPPEGAASDRGP
ncbi:MAG TPA: glycogen-binding domain-containing protein [Vicinamibacteria bacterium]|nr:glycogen-binding domain-containing protein [Vicinamibacteria bacterium]